MNVRTEIKKADMILPTNLKHISSSVEFDKVLSESENVMVVCGRMGPMCIPVYKAMKEIEADYDHVDFRDMAFDNADAHVIKNLPECRGFMGLPFTVYFKNGKVAAATTSIQNKEQITEVLDRVF